MRTVLVWLALVLVALWFVFGSDDARGVEDPSLPRGGPVEELLPADDVAAPLARTPETAARRSEQAESVAPSPVAPVVSGGPVEPEEPVGFYEILVVVEETNEPYVGAMLVLSNERGSFVYESMGEKTSSGGPRDDLHTNEVGRASFRVPADTEFFLLVKGTGPAAAETQRSLLPLVPGERRDVIVSLPTVASSPFHGIVLDRASGVPISGALVGAKVDEATLAEAVTDGSGRFGLTLPGWEAFQRLEVRCTGYADAVAYPNLLHDDPEDPQRILLGRPASLHAEVPSAEPLKYRVVLSVSGYDFAQTSRGSSGWSSSEDRAFQAQVGEGGFAVLRDLPPAVPLDVEVQRSGIPVWRRGEPIVLESGEERFEVLAIASGATIAGHVVESDGSPASELSLWLLSAHAEYETHPGPIYLESWQSDVLRRASTDQDGAFSFENLSDGLWLVGIKPMRDSFGSERGSAKDPAPIGRAVRIEGGASVTDLLLQTHRGLYVRGTVLDPDGKPVEDVDVGVVPGWEGDTDENGAFSIGPLLPGTCEVHTFTSDHDELGGASVEATVGDEDLVITLPRAGIVSGILVSAAGSPQRGTVQLSSTSEGERGWFHRVGESDGHFVVGGVAPGTYRVVATGDAGGISVDQLVTLGVGERVEGLRIVLGPSCQLVLISPREGVFARVLVDGTLIGGLFREAGVSFVPPGRITLEFLAGNERRDLLETREVEARAGEVLEIRFPLEDR